IYAEHRNINHSIELTRLAFLHGNVRQGFCEEHKRVNYLSAICERYQKPLKPTSLLYPIKKKNYAENEVIRIQWDRLAVYLDNAFMLTIFVYSGPRTDEEESNIIKKQCTKQTILDDKNYII